MWKEYIGLEVSGSYDNVFHGIGQGQIFFSLPFGPRTVVKAKNRHCQTTCYAAEKLDMRMIQPVIRDEIIVLNKHRRHSVAINPSTNDPYVFWFVDNTSHSAGTFKSPFNTLLAAQNASGPGDIIYVFPGDSTSTGMSSGITLQNGQRLLGATTSHRLGTTAGTITISPQASGNLPLLTNSSGNVVTLANDNLVSGLYIQNLNGHGIYGNAVNNTAATRNFIQGSGASPYNGVEWDNVTGTASLSNNTIMNENYCVYINNTLPVSNATYSLKNNLLDNNGGASDYVMFVNYVEGSNNTFLFSGNNMIGSGEYGLGIGCSNTTPNVAHTFIVSNNQIDSPYYPVYIESNGTTFGFALIDNSFNVIEVPFSAFLDGASTMTTTISRNSFNSGGQQVYLDVFGTSTLTGSITNNTFTTTGTKAGLTLSASASGNFSSLEVSNNTFVGGTYGVSIANTATALPSSFNVKNNSFSVQSIDGIRAVNTGSSNLRLNISANTFQGFAGNAVNVSQTGTGTTCLSLNSNTTNLFPNSYLLQQTAGTFNFQTSTGNAGQLMETGTITPVTSCQKVTLVE